MKVCLYQESPTRGRAGLPLTVAQARSGDIVEEWLPQTTTLEISPTAIPVEGIGF